MRLHYHCQVFTAERAQNSEVVPTLGLDNMIIVLTIYGTAMKGREKLPRYRKIIKSGDVVEIEEYTSLRPLQQHYRRREKQNTSTEDQTEINYRNAVKNLSRLINTNFSQGDLFISLTYRNRATLEEANHELTLFLRRLKRYRIKKDMPPLKYVAVTEHEDKREHHHLIINAMPTEDLKRLWKHGRVLMSWLEPGEYTGLSVYITKETIDPHRKRWRQSQNLEKPEIIIREISDPKKRRSIRVPKGFIVLERYEYYSAVCGSCSYLKCIKSGGTEWDSGG